MMETSLSTIAGFISTGLFALGTLPMLSKALRTKNLASYSLGNILLSNVGNIIYSVYVFKLPPGPVWVLYIYNLVSTGLMLVWYLKFEGLPQRQRSSGDQARARYLLPLCCSPAL
jgi:uncharacterized protein with PQ loop repeat